MLCCCCGGSVCLLLGYMGLLEDGRMRKGFHLIILLGCRGRSRAGDLSIKLSEWYNSTHMQYQVLLSSRLHGWTKTLGFTELTTWYNLEPIHARYLIFHLIPETYAMPGTFLLGCTGIPRSWGFTKLTTWCNWEPVQRQVPQFSQLHGYTMA